MVALNEAATADRPSKPDTWWIATLRTPVAKILERLIAYGAVAVLVALGLSGEEAEAETADLAAPLAYLVAGILLFGVQAVIDYLHHRADTAAAAAAAPPSEPPGPPAPTPVGLILALVGLAGFGVMAAGIGAAVPGCVAGTFYPPSTLGAQYVRLSNTFTDAMESLEDMRLVGWIDDETWADHVVPAAEAANAVLEDMLADVEGGRTEIWTAAEGLGRFHDALTVLRNVEAAHEATRAAEEAREGAIGGEAWLGMMILATGLVNALVRLLERGQVTEVTPAQIEEATARRRAVMDRVRAAAERGDVPAVLGAIVGTIDPDRPAEETEAEAERVLREEGLQVDIDVGGEASPPDRTPPPAPAGADTPGENGGGC